MEATLDRLVAHSLTLARVSGWICGLLLTVSAFLIGLDIALREIFVVTLGGANELSGYALAVSSSWGCTVALVHRMHVRIDSVYTHLSGPERFVIYRWRVWIVIAVAVLLSITSAAWHRRFDARHGIAALGVGYGLVHFLGQGKGWEYQLYPLAAFAAVLAFSEVDLLMRTRSFSFGVPIAASLVGIAILLTVKGGEAADAAWIWDKERLVRLVVSDLAARRRSGDLVQVLDTTAGGLHALLRLHAVQPTRFVYDFPLFQEVDEPVVRRFQAEFLRDLTAHPPRFIVVFERGWPRGTYDRVDSFPAFARWLERSYLVVAQRRDGYVIFAQRNDP